MPHLGHQHFVNFGRYPPLNWLLLFFIVAIALITVLSSPSLNTLNVISSSSVLDIHSGFTSLREQAASDLSEIQSLSLGTIPLRELELCGKERENHVPCYNVSVNLLAGFDDGDEFDRHCKLEGDDGTGCLVRPPKDYKIPLRWPAGRDVIWSGNVKITKDQFLSSGSMTKRLMLLEENQVAFHSEDAVNFDSVKDYSRQIAEMIGLGSDSEFIHAGRHSKIKTVLCEPFPTYPRTYDMLHAIGLLSHQLTLEKCDISDLLLEMDRILRPEGWVILRDTIRAIERARTLVAQLRWDARVIDLQSGGDQRLLVCQKPFLKK